MTMPRADAAARVAAAGLLSRWVARPGFHVLRPERALIRNLCEPIASLTDRDRVNRELGLHAELRLREPQREGIAATATRFGLLTLGRIHWFVARQQCNKIFPAAGEHGAV
ncbi:MAG: hypothetical protein IH940_05110 [Acidobacteria bacterium]|nr:hypothetical protein [Acidobacteriota bacterium]